MSSERLKVNFSQDEADSKVREVPPSGTYLCSVVDAEIREVKPGSPNVGKPYWSLRYVIQDGRYADSSIFANVMLFSTDKTGTLSQLSQLLKALGYTVSAGEFEIPTDEEIQGKMLMVTGRKVPAGTKDGKDFPEQFRVTGYKAADSTGSKPAGNSSILP
jgi:hypothetical protein